MAMGSQEFTSVIKAIGTAKSRMDEEYIVNKEIVTLKKKMSQPDLPPKTMKELILRLLFVEMLGRDASFGHIHAVKMTQSSNLLLKKVGIDKTGTQKIVIVWVQLLRGKLDQGRIMILVTIGITTHSPPPFFSPFSRQ